MIAEHIALHDLNILFAVALVALILAGIGVVASSFRDLVAWAASLTALTLVISWWP